ncbi:MAG TPA: DUF1992 domain-containing protein [Anaerolineales bacterium]|nr:DUF1992 domain-containing protein [Anaerolineales bacterium]
MSFDRIVEAIIQEAMERGEFDNLAGKGKPIDLTEYFETPEEVRMAYSVLKSAGITPREVDLLKEIARLKETLEQAPNEQERHEIEQQIRQKQVEFDLMMERQKHQKVRKRS